MSSKILDGYYLRPTILVYTQKEGNMTTVPVLCVYLIFQVSRLSTTIHYLYIKIYHRMKSNTISNFAQYVIPLPKYLESVWTVQGVDCSLLIIKKSFEFEENKTYDQFIKSFERDTESPGIAKSYLEPEWVDCKNSCKATLPKYINHEMNSTAFILRCLQKSMIRNNPTINVPLKISCTDDSNISGIWESDQHLFKLDNFANQAKGRLIMGFGPSASGKSYWSAQIISILKRMDDEFPTQFLSIDGGIYREASGIYQSIVKNVIDKNMGGFSNLVSAAGGSSLFSAGKIKKAISHYLKMQSYSPNLYVPETLGSCRKGFNFSKLKLCSKSFDIYKEITKVRSWVGVCIWQHVEDTQCVFAPKYKCTGCTESGQSRERKEGKQYSAANWAYSLKHGIKYAKNADRWFIIHNTGGRKYRDEKGHEVPCINLIESSMVPSDEMKVQLQQDYNCRFIDEMKNETRV